MVGSPDVIQLLVLNGAMGGGLKLLAFHTFTSVAGFLLRWGWVLGIEPVSPDNP